MPGQGTRSMFTIGLGMGVWLGILGALGLAHTRVRPSVWKRSLGLISDEEQAGLRAQPLFPQAGLRLCNLIIELRPSCWRSTASSVCTPLTQELTSMPM